MSAQAAESQAFTIDVVTEVRLTVHALLLACSAAPLLCTASTVQHQLFSRPFLCCLAPQQALLREHLTKKKYAVTLEAFKSEQVTKRCCSATVLQLYLPWSAMMFSNEAMLPAVVANMQHSWITRNLLSVCSACSFCLVVACTNAHSRCCSTASTNAAYCSSCWA
jgi:hypothetical protein